MKPLQRLCKIVAASLMLTCGFISPSIGQSSEIEKLDQQIRALYQSGKYGEAIPLAQRELALSEKMAGSNHAWDAWVAHALNDLAESHRKLGNFAAAEPLFKRALAITEKVLGPNNPSVAAVLYNLATLYSAQAHYADAEAHYKRSLDIEEKALGPEHPQVSMTLDALASLYSNEGRYVDAEPLYKRALAIDEKALGPGHPNVAASLTNLASLYREQGRYADAEPLFKRALVIEETALGPDHPDVAKTLYDLANLYADEARYADAAELYKRALTISEKALGPDHPVVGAALSGLVNLYTEQGRYADAEPLVKRELEIGEKALGRDNPETARALAALARLYTEQGRYADAEPLIKRQLATMEKALGPDHDEVAASLAGLAHLYLDQGRYADAEPLLKRALAIEEKALGPDHPWVATALNNLAHVYLVQGRYADAEPLFKRALAIGEKVFGSNHPEVATSLLNLAELYRKQGRYADAEPLFKRALAIEEKALGPDEPRVATALNNVANLYIDQGRYADAEPLLKRSLAIAEKTKGPDHADVVATLQNLAGLYAEQKRYADALPIVQRMIAHLNGGGFTASALPVLFGAWTDRLMPADLALDLSLNAVQRALQTSAGMAVKALALRLSAGTGRLAELVRKDQDLAGEAAVLDKSIIAAVSKEPSKRDAAAEQRIRDRIGAIAKERDELGKVFQREFPDYTALAHPEPLTVRDIQTLLAEDEALVVIDIRNRRRGGLPILDTKSYVWVITKTAADWRELAVAAPEVSKKVSFLRGLLDVHSIRPFDTQASFELYRAILAPIEAMLHDKPRVSLVLNGALTSLPPQLLVTRDPAGKALRDVDWFVRSHAVTVLPSIASLKVLRGKSAAAEAASPLIGFANPVFDRDPRQLQNARVAANVTAARGLRGTVADIAELRTALAPLPETADELRRVAASVHAEPAGLILGADATETRVKREKLDRYRVLYFATHGLLAGDVADFTKLNAEPALVLSLPEHPTEFDDGLLTASEVAQLKLNADWVVLSACNTASGDKPGAEALSGLARAFFYAGGRSLLVSNWEVDSDSAVELMVLTFAALAADPKLSHAQALQKSMLAMIDNAQHPERADPKYWAPFVVVGEPAKPAN